MAAGFYRLFRWMVLALPLFAFLCLLIVPFIPGGFRLMDGSPYYWYQPMTTTLFLIGLVYVFPVTKLAIAIFGDGSFLGPVFYLVAALYTAAWIFLLHRIFSLAEAWWARKRAS